MNLTKKLLPLALTCGLLGSGMSMAEQTRDLVQEEANRALVLNFFERFFNQHQTAEASKVMVDDYRQHNPHVPDGKAPMVGYFTEFFKKNPAARSKVIRSASDGDLVYLHVHSTATPQDRGTAIVDIFRVKDGRIVEHWDVIHGCA